VSTKTSIEWTKNDDGSAGRTWNPAVGCDKVSPGCGLPRFEGDKTGGCYAENIARRFAGTKAFPNGFDVTLHPERLTDPLKWRKPTRVFVNSMSDLFHDRIPDEFIARVFAVMAVTPQHSYMILTKRHARMRSLLRSGAFAQAVWREFNGVGEWSFGRTVKLEDWERAAELLDPRRGDAPMPALPGVMLGVSAEDQHWAEVRIPALLETPAATRFVSLEPLLGPIDLRNLKARGVLMDALGGDVSDPRDGVVYTSTPSVLDLVICGAESGLDRDARAMDVDWVRSLRDQVKGAPETAFFYKQDADHGKKIPTPQLDGRVWVEMPRMPQAVA
jgi:protein gp37